MPTIKKMSKKKKNHNNNTPEINVVQFEVDPRIENAIYSQKDSLITITTNDSNGKPVISRFHLVYDAVEDIYNFCGSGMDRARFFATMYSFSTDFGVISIRTFLDETSHQKFREDGMSEAIPFQEMRMFKSDGKKVEQCSAAEIFLAIMIDAKTGRFHMDRYAQEEIYCDERQKVPAPIFMEQLQNIMA